MNDLIENAIPEVTLSPCDRLLDDVIKESRARIQAFEENLDLYEPLLRVEDRFTRVAVDAKGELDLSLAGTKGDLNKVVTLFRQNNFAPNFRPEANDTTWGTCWHHPRGIRIWFYFTSSQCRRVKVGTKTVEQPIYETQCDEVLEDFS